MNKDKKDLTPLNYKGERHGYWELHYGSGLIVKCTFHNDNYVGYREITYPKRRMRKMYHII